MTEKHKSQTEDPEVAIQSAIGRVEGFIMNNGRSLLTALIVVVVVVGGFFGYKYLISGPRAEKAAAMMFVAEQQFAVDSFALALNGDGNFAGFLEVIDRYGSTDEGNLARHYAGICYLRLGEYQQALDYLKEYSASTKSVPEALWPRRTAACRAMLTRSWRITPRRSGCTRRPLPRATTRFRHPTI